MTLPPTIPTAYQTQKLFLLELRSVEFPELVATYSCVASMVRFDIVDQAIQEGMKRSDQVYSLREI